MHIPVLLKEVIRLLDPQKGNVIIDGTVGSGGHASEIFKRILPDGRLLGIDWDSKALDTAKLRISDEIKNQKSKIKNNLILIHGNYTDLPEIIEKNHFPKADGLLLDLGFSSEQLEKRGRGFSFRRDEPLIMTYSDESEPLEHFLKRTNVRELTCIIREFSEERHAKRIAEAIIAERHKIITSKMLADVIQKAVPKSYEKGRLHPATRTFQALRIFLNKELDNLKKVLESLNEIIKPGGRAVIISFHSLEDRIVKRCFIESTKKGRLKILTKNPIIAGPEEIIGNPRSRSAKLRAAAVI